MDKILYDKIIAANIEVHKKEAGLYDIIHTFGLNWYIQKLLTHDIGRIIALAPGKKACDLGCGTGNVTKKLLDAGCAVTAVDLSESMLMQLNKNIAPQNKLNIFCMNLDRFLAESADKYDIITFNAVLHHMPDYINTILIAMSHLNLGGLLYIFDGTHRIKVNKCYEFLRRFFFWIDRRLYVVIHGNRKIIYNHGIDYTYSDYHCNAAGTNGLDLIKIKEVIEKEGVKPSNILGCNIGMLMGTLALLDNMLPISKNCFRLIAQKH